jgi:phosphate acetyltransferase
MSYSFFVSELISKLKSKVAQFGIPTIIFPEGENPLIQQAVQRLKNTNLINPVLLFTNRTKLSSLVVENELKYIILEDYNLNEIAEKLFILRNGKLTLDKAQQLIQEPNYFAT